MSGTAEILQEYLVKLGFQTDAISLKKFEDGLGVTGKKILTMGTAVAGLVAAVEAATISFAYSMRRVYFDSELSGSSVQNMKAMEYAGKQIGISGETMESAIHGMAQAVRLNPGLQGLVESFGVPVKGRDMSDVMLDFVKATKSMPEFVGAQYAGMFGIDPDTYHQMINHMDTLMAKKREAINMYKDSGVDPKKAKAAIMEFTQGLDKLEMRINLLGQALLIRFVGPFRDANKYLNGLIDSWMRLVNLPSWKDQFMNPMDLVKNLSKNPESRGDVESYAKSSVMAPLNLANDVSKAIIGFFNPWGHWDDKQFSMGNKSAPAGLPGMPTMGSGTYLGTSGGSYSPVMINTEINVHSSADAGKVAGMVADKQVNVAKDIVRNFKGNNR